MKIHPLFLVLFLYFFMYGELALITLYFLALVLHELGHLMAARLLHVPVKSCVLYPYGGEIKLVNEYAVSALKMVLILAGGPVMSLLSVLISSSFVHQIAEMFRVINIALLLVNLLPLWPLDGGRLIVASYSLLGGGEAFYEHFITFSFVVTFLLLLFFAIYFGIAAIVLLILFVFILLVNWQEWRARKYKVAFQKAQKNRFLY